MRSCAAWLSSRAEVRLRRTWCAGGAPPTPPQVDQNISDRTRPIAPTTIRMMPMVLMSRPDTVALTAQVRMAPTAIRIRLTPMPIEILLQLLPTVISCPWWALIERLTGRFRLRLIGLLRSSNVGARAQGIGHSACRRSRWSLAVIATAVALFIPWLPVAGGRGGRPHPLRLLVHDRDLHRRLRGRRGRARLLGLEVPRQAGRRLRRPADPRPHAARDHLDGDPGRARDGDLDRQRDRARAEQPTPATNPLVVKVDGAAVRLDVHVPERQDLRVS